MIKSSAVVFAEWLGPLLFEGFSYVLGGTLFLAPVGIVSLGAKRCNYWL